MPNFAVVGALVLDVVLHALWDIINSLDIATVTQFAIVVIGTIVRAGISLTLVIRRLREVGKLLVATVPTPP